MKKVRRSLIVLSLLTIFGYFVCGFGYCLFTSSFSNITLRYIGHIFSGIFFTFALTRVGVHYKENLNQKDVVWGVAGNMTLIIWWEIIYQPVTRYHQGQIFYIQWEQILCGLLGIMIATCIWLVRCRSFSKKRKASFVFTSTYLSTALGKILTIVQNEP